MDAILSILKNFDKIIFVGGGTGGHITPIVSLSKLLDHPKDFLWIGGKNSEEEKEAIKHNIPFIGIPVLKLSTTTSPKVLLYPFALQKTIFSAYKILKQEQKKVQNLAIFSKGWPGALAIGIAAKWLWIPVFIHESDTIPGRSNLRMARFAEKIFLGFESTKSFFSSKKCVYTGQILDPIIFKKNTTQSIKYKTRKYHILVFCGSQWARSIFEEIIKNCGNINAEWIVVLGKLNGSMKEKFKNFGHIQVVDWIAKEDQNVIFETTDLAITRGSATTLAELDAFKIPKIIVPLPSAAKNHQFFNAKEYEKTGDTVLLQKDMHQICHHIYKMLTK